MKRKPIAKKAGTSMRLTDPGDVLAAISKDIQGLKRISNVERIQCIPTIFTGLNRALGTGGWPRKGVSLVHGPNSKGKTVLALGVLLSFARAGEITLYADIERATDDVWIKSLIGKLSGDVGYYKPQNLNVMERSVRKLVDRLSVLQVKSDRSLCVAIDTINKLNPERTMTKVAKEGLKAGRNERAGQQSEWLTELLPLIDDHMTHMLFVCQERMNQDRKTDYDPKFLPAVPQSFLFDNQVQIRVWGASPLKIGDTVVGFEHHAGLAKSKVGIGGRVNSFSFFTSNGMGDCPLGFDHARDIVGECRERGGEFYRKVERDNHEWIESVATGEKVAVKGGEREFRKILRAENGLLEAYRKALDVHIPEYYESLRIGDGDGQA